MVKARRDAIDIYRASTVYRLRPQQILGPVIHFVARKTPF